MANKVPRGNEPSVYEELPILKKASSTGNKDLETILAILLKNKELLENGIRKEDLKLKILQDKKKQHINELQKIFDAKRVTDFDDLDMCTSHGDFLTEDDQDIPEEYTRCVSEDSQVISDQPEDADEHCDDVVPREETTDKSGTSFTVAIDFGSMESSYNALCHTGLGSADDVNWNLDLLCSEDMETCILLDKDGKCDGIGENARRKYEDLIRRRRDGGYSFFRDFKKGLITKQNKDVNHVIKDKKGDPVSAMAVMSAWLREKKTLYTNALLKQHGEKSEGYHLSWCITVPGSCTDAGKQFLVKAARKAGMSDVKLVCDTEAAFLYFKHLCANDNNARELGESPFVIDVGARFLSFAAYKTLPNGTTREVGATGFVLDDACDVKNVLWDMLTDAFGQDVIRNYRAAYITQSEEIEATWVEKVQSIRPEKYFLTNTVLKLHPTLIAFIKAQVKKNVSSRQKCSYVSVLGNILRVDLTTAHKKLRLLCDRMISKLRLKIGQTYITYERHILLSGGFPALHILKEGIEQNFKGTEVTILANPKSAVPVGASFVNVQT